MIVTTIASPPASALSASPLLSASSQPTILLIQH